MSDFGGDWSTSPWTGRTLTRKRDWDGRLSSLSPSLSHVLHLSARPLLHETHSSPVRSPGHAVYVQSTACFAPLRPVFASLIHCHGLLPFSDPWTALGNAW
jgi:hypothetical protein